MRTPSFTLAAGLTLLLLAVGRAAAAPCPPDGALLLEVRRQAMVPDPHRANTVSTIEGTFACKSGLGVTTKTAVASVFVIAPDVALTRVQAPAALAALNRALAAAHVAGLASCSLPSPAGSEEYVTLRWHGRGARFNTFSFAIGFTDLYPACTAEAEALLAAVRAYAAALPEVPGAEVYTFPR